MAAIGEEVRGAKVLDLFAGSGALGLEALSRGAGEVVFVERSRNALKTLRANLDLLDAWDECTVVPGDAMTFVRRLEVGDLDLVLADPPYETGLAAELISLFQEKRFAGALWVEHRSTEAIPPVPDLRQRRYGDTTLSTLKRDA